MHPVEARIRETIRRHGPIPFSRFMELSLFSPLGGYYATAEAVGARGDYYTSPTAHPLFGRLLATQIEQMWALLGRPDPFTVVEAGAGTGLLARDIVAGCVALDPRLARALRYVALDRVRPPGGDLLPAGASRLVAQGLPLRGIVGCVLSNELFDCFPVHRFQVQGGRPMEVYVGLVEDELGEVLDEPSDPEVARRVRAATGDGLPEGYRGEVCLGLDPWAAEVAGALDRGFVISVDYGGAAEELYAPHRARGTLRCYYRHTVSGNPYVRVGRQDITAHVDFSELGHAGERHGLTTLGYGTQHDFLRNLGADSFFEALARRARRGANEAPGRGTGESSLDARVPGGRATRPEHDQGGQPPPAPERRRMTQGEYQANRMAMAGLLDPQGLGGFRVLIQGKGIGEPTLWGFDPDNSHRHSLAERLDALEAPVRSETHTPLMEGRYPHAAFEADWGWGLGPGEEPGGAR